VSEVVRDDVRVATLDEPVNADRDGGGGHSSARADHGPEAPTTPTVSSTG
jgi:hypothetical protein